MKKYAGILIIFLLLVACSNNDDSDSENEGGESLTGTWTGQIETPPIPLDFIVTFEDDEGWKGYLSIPIQNLHDYPLSNLSLQDDEISFDMELPQETINFEGELTSDSSIEGTFTQRGLSFPFQLSEGDDSLEEDEDAVFLSVETEHGTLQGELLVPEGVDEFPVVLIIPGSGPTDRDGNSAAMPGKNNSLKMLAEGLAEEGIASLRYSKRGAGENADAVIPEADVRFEDFINDAEAWIDLLKSDERFTQVGVVGHSKGALIGLMAAKETDVDAYVSVAGAGVPTGDLLYEQLANQLPPALLEEAEEILNSLRAGDVVDQISEELYAVFRPEAQDFLMSWMAYDPAEELSEFNAPTLIVQGTTDIQVSEENAEILHEAKSDSELLIVEGMNHVLKEAPEDEVGNIQTYTDPQLPLADGLVDGIVEFFNRIGFH